MSWKMAARSARAEMLGWRLEWKWEPRPAPGLLRQNGPPRLLAWLAWPCWHGDKGLGCGGQGCTDEGGRRTNDRDRAT